MLFGLIECRIAARTKRPSGPADRTCYHARQIDTRQRTHSPYLFRLHAGVRMLYVPAVKYERITSRPRCTAGRNGQGRCRESERDEARKRDTYLHLTVLNVTRIKPPLNLNLFADRPRDIIGVIVKVKSQTYIYTRSKRAVRSVHF